MAGKNGNRESMAKGLSTERREEERPKCPECGAPDPQSHGTYWLCNACGRHFTKKLRGKVRKEFSDRPTKCPYCGQTEQLIWASAGSWYCQMCGKKWLKLKGINKARKELGERPACPSCGTPNPSSHGVRWHCVNPNCGKKWNKLYQRLPIVSPVELRTAPIIRA